MGKIVIKINDKEYTLEFNRYAIVEMEKRGFDISKAEKLPLSTLTELSRGAFIMHHSNMKFDDIDEIVDCIDNKGEFVKVLAEMYKDAIECFVSGKGGNKGNATWGRA